MSTLSRRTFLQQAAAVAAVRTVLPATAAEPKPAGIVDCNISIGHWPFRYHSGQETSSIPAQCQRLRDNGLTQGWAGSIEGIFQRDVFLANEILRDRCEEHSNGLLLPAFTINPALPSWEHDLSRCRVLHDFRVIRLHPNYQGYTLDAPCFLKLLQAATEAKFLIQIVTQLEDERTQHPLMQVKPVNLKPLSAALTKVPDARVMVLNANRTLSMTALQGCPVWIDIALLEGVGGVENLLRDWPLDKLVFGSHAPLFYWAAAKLKLQESDLSEKQLAAIMHENATRSLHTV